MKGSYRKRPTTLVGLLKGIVVTAVVSYVGISVGYFTGWLIATVPGWF